MLTSKGFVLITVLITLFSMTTLLMSMTSRILLSNSLLVEQDKDLQNIQQLQLGNSMFTQLMLSPDFLAQIQNLNDEKKFLSDKEKFDVADKLSCSQPHLLDSEIWQSVEIASTQLNHTIFVKFALVTKSKIEDDAYSYFIIQLSCVLHPNLQVWYGQQQVYQITIGEFDASINLKNIVRIYRNIVYEPTVL